MIIMNDKVRGEGSNHALLENTSSVNKVTLDTSWMSKV
jgi:hypothetical protein